MSGRERLHFDVLSPAAVVKGGETVELGYPVLIRAHPGLAGRVVREHLRLPVHQEIGPEVGGREEFEVEPGLPFEGSRHGLVKQHADNHTFTVRRYLQHGAEAVVGIFERGADGGSGGVHAALHDLGVDVPLLGSVGKPDAASGGNAHAAEYDFYSSLFFVGEDAGVFVAVNQHVGTSCLKVFEFVEFEVLGLGRSPEKGGGAEHGKDFVCHQY